MSLERYDTKSLARKQTNPEKIEQPTADFLILRFAPLANLWEASRAAPAFREGVAARGLDAMVHENFLGKFASL